MQTNRVRVLSCWVLPSSRSHSLRTEGTESDKLDFKISWRIRKEKKRSYISPNEQINEYFTHFIMKHEVFVFDATAEQNQKRKIYYSFILTCLIIYTGDHSYS